MVQDLTGAGVSSEGTTEARRPYLAPFVRNRNMTDTNGKRITDVYEITNGSLVGIQGPS